MTTAGSGLGDKKKINYTINILIVVVMYLPWYLHNIIIFGTDSTMLDEGR